MIGTQPHLIHVDPGFAVIYSKRSVLVMSLHGHLAWVLSTIYSTYAVYSVILLYNVQSSTLISLSF